ncbi:MAG: hypothetical protein IKD70_04145 [Eggerthellaceae bacterium]|nr:hypothetical protein [Eggerthellaceae bacterium]
MTERTDVQELNFEKYNAGTHLLGRLCTAICLLMFLGVPFVMGLHLGVMPDMGAVVKGFLAIGLVYLVSCVAEYLIYVPILGGGGSYLAFITGNLINMKIPCAMNARDIVEVKAGTPENEIISTLSIATSSLVTIVVLALGVAALIPLEPVLQNPVLTPAFDNVVPALFGAMAYKYYRKDLPVAWVPLLVMTLLFLFVPGLRSSVSMMIIPAGAIAIGLALYRFLHGKYAKEEAKAE